MVELPFDPNVVWGEKPRHHVRGTINGKAFRGPLDRYENTIVLGPAWCRDNEIAAGEKVKVMLYPEGPQRDDLDEDIATALAAEPEAGAFFDGLAQFYRKGYLKWILSTKRSPAERKRRIGEMIALLKAGVKQRPK